MVKDDDSPLVICHHRFEVLIKPVLFVQLPSSHFELFLQSPLGIPTIIALVGTPSVCP